MDSRIKWQVSWIRQQHSTKLVMEITHCKIAPCGAPIKSTSWTVAGTTLLTPTNEKSIAACNTSINQYLVLNVARTTIVNPQIKTAAPPVVSNRASLNLLSVMAIWAQAEGGLLDLISPLARPSLLYLPSAPTTSHSFP
jgi:hypothetical protein